jgi:hypothetical protein
MDAVQPFAKREPGRIGRGEAELSDHLSPSGTVEGVPVVPIPSPTTEGLRKTRAPQLLIPVETAISLQLYIIIDILMQYN